MIPQRTLSNWTRVTVVAATVVGVGLAAVSPVSAAPSSSPSRSSSTRSAPPPPPPPSPPKPAPAPAPRAPTPAPRPPATAPAPPAANSPTTFGSFGGAAKVRDGKEPIPAPSQSSRVGAFGSNSLSAAPGSVVKPANGLASDLASTAAKKQAMDTYEARKADRAGAQADQRAFTAPPTTAAGPMLLDQPSNQVGGGAASPTRSAANDTQVQQLEDQRRRARAAEDERDDAERRARIAQSRAAAAEMDAAAARRRVLAGAAAGGVAGYAGASTFGDATQPAADPTAGLTATPAQAPAADSFAPPPANARNDFDALSEHAAGVMSAALWVTGLVIALFIGLWAFRSVGFGSGDGDKGRYEL